MSKVELCNINKSFNGRKILKDINLTVEEGEFCVLLGPSGCGKSTLLRIIAGLTRQDSGHVLINDKIADKDEPKDRNLSFVFQSYALYPHLTVEENIAFPLKIRGTDKKTIKKAVSEAVEILNLSDSLKKKPRELSGGQRQRVALGRAIVRKPEFFLMDEPLSNLDAALRTTMRSELKKLQHRLGATIIYVTHDQTEALTMGDKIAVLNGGILQQTGTPQEIYNNPRNIFVAKFVGTLPMNILEINGRTVGFRPEDMEFGENGELKLKISENYADVLGRDKVVHFTINNQECLAKVRTELDTKNIILSVKKERLHYFDEAKQTDL